MKPLLIGLLAFTTPDPFPGEPPTPAGRFEAIRRDWRSHVDEMKATAARLSTNEAIRRHHEAGEPREHALYARALDLAEGHPDDPAAVDALAWVVYRGVPPERGKALRRIIGHHAASPRLKPALHFISMRRHHLQVDADLYETLLREVLAKNPDRDCRGLACLRLGQLARLRAEALVRLDQFPDHYRAIYRGHGLGPKDLEKLRERTPVDLAREAERRFERTVAEFADVKDWFDPGREDVSLGSLGDGAGKELREVRDLAIGKVAPAIEGRDIDGASLKLADHRGKVVALVFWGSWRGPCMAEVPGERALVKRLEGRPFVLLGINGGENDREQARRVVRDEGITWRSWWDGTTQDGPIASRWNVDAWPTTYVLDAQGVIRFKDLRGDQLGQAVDSLLEKMGKPDGGVDP